MKMPTRSREVRRGGFATPLADQVGGVSSLVIIFVVMALYTGLIVVMGKRWGLIGSVIAIVGGIPISALLGMLVDAMFSPMTDGLRELMVSHEVRKKRSTTASAGKTDDESPPLADHASA